MPAKRYHTTILRSVTPIRIPRQAWEWKSWTRFRWLERFVKRWVLKLFSQSVDLIPQYETVTIDCDSLRELVYQAMNSQRRMAERVWDGEIKHIVIGQKQAESIANDLQGVSRFLDIPLQLEMHRGTWSHRYMGLTVHVVPWYDGILFLPDMKQIACQP